jgi:hypothetical protein
VMKIKNSCFFREYNSTSIGYREHVACMGQMLENIFVGITVG